MSEPFVHLKCHTEYALVDGLVRVPALIEACHAFDMPAVAVTDHSNFFALVKFYKQATKAKIKPIFGADLVLEHDGVRSVFTALCQNDLGYKNLTELISLAYLKGQTKDEPRVQWQWVQDYADGLIILSGGLQSDVGLALKSNKNDQATQHAKRWQGVFGDRYYMELTRANRTGEEAVTQATMALAQSCDIPVVATNDVRFIDPDDFLAHEARVCIHDGYVLDDARRPRNYSEEQYFKSADEMAELFADVPAALKNTVEIMKRCNAHLSLGKNYLPAFPVPAGQTEADFLRSQSQKGLDAHLTQLSLNKEDQQVYQDRLDRECQVITDMGFPGYFLIVSDFIQWAKSQGIPVGPGRGSGAGSLVAYVLGITMLDPIEHELLFERFLNPERVSMPDFDIDFCMERRDEVIDYVAEKYGRDAVSQIITYGTMAAKAVVRDVGRVQGMPYGFVDKIAKLIPFELGMTLDKALEQEDQLRERYEQEEEVTGLIDMARKLEGVARNAGKHAGGVLIAPTKLTDFTAIYCEPGSDSMVSQFDKDDVESVGLVKFDFLGLRTLTIIDWAVRAINATRDKSEHVDIDAIPLDDEQTFALLNRCETTAVFQLESRGMKDLVRRLKPDNFDEITALVALFRPGPLQSGMVDDFIDRKHGRAEVKYVHPDLAPILRSTYGVILYQEQVMQIAQSLANYTLGGADILRRAMGKKKPEEMAKQREFFVSGAKANGIDETIATTIFDLMEKFAGYGFNKSHSAAYALIAYQTAWLKAHYPAEFMAAVLSSDMDNTDKVVGFIAECEKMSVAMRWPDINLSAYPFVVNSDGEIQYGLGAIKGVGEAAIEQIVAERQAAGPYKSLFDLCQRVDMRKLNKRVLEALIKSGALDSIGPNRASMVASIPRAAHFAEQQARNAAQGQDDLFGEVQTTDDCVSTQYIDVPAALEETRLEGEKETLGRYVSGHPLTALANEIDSFMKATIAECREWMGKHTTLVGLVLGVRTIMTKRGKKMAVIQLEDLTGSMDVTVFSDLYEQKRELLVKDNVLVVKGEVSHDDFTGGVKMVADKLTDMKSLRQRMVRRVVIKMEDDQTIAELLPELSEKLQVYRGGQCPVVIAYQGSGVQTELKLGDNWCIRTDREVIQFLQQTCGQENVHLEYE